MHTPSAQFAPLPWSRYRILLQVFDKAARDWYAKEAYEETWSSRTLQRNVDTQYYYRMLKTQDPAVAREEMQEKASAYQANFLSSDHNCAKKGTPTFNYWCPYFY